MSRPIGMMAGSHPWCKQCEILTGCSSLHAVGSATNSFFGLCCTCQPKRVCVSLWIDDECGCTPQYHSSYSPVSTVEVEWDCDSNAYSGELRCADPDLPPIDFQIGYEQIPFVDEIAFVRTGDCYLVLRSAYLGYIFPDRVGLTNIGTDTRIWIPAGGPYHDSETRRIGCSELGYEFEIDLPYCGTARITIDKTDHVCRQGVITGTETAYTCIYDRTCITYTPEDPYEESSTVYACLNATDDADYLGVFSGIEDADVVHFGIDRINDDEIQLTYVKKDGSTTTIESIQPLVCPGMAATWTLASGATVRIAGDPHADCVDCLCWCRTLCVTLYNSDQPGIWRATLAWDEEEKQWAGDLTNTDSSYSRSVIIALVCNECDQTTRLQIQTATKTVFATVDCNEIDVSTTFAEYDESSTTVSVKCRKCGDDCFDVFLLSAPCCPDDDIPSELSLTIEPDDADYDPGPPEIPGAGRCDGAAATVALVYQGAQPGGGFVNEWWGNAFIFSGCPETRVFFELRCKNVSGDLYQWELSVRDGIESQEYLSEFTACNPLQIEFRKIQVGATNACCDPVEVVDTINNYKATVTL